MYARAQKFWYSLLLVGLSVGLFIPFFKVFWPETHDMLSYPIRTIEYVHGWRSGYIFPRWAPDMYGGYGCPFFNFYAPGLSILSGAFVLLGAIPTVALKLALLLLTVIGALGLFQLVWEETRRMDASLFAGVIFLFMPYHFTVLYTRGAYSEYAALCLVPVSVWLYRCIARTKVRWLPLVIAGAAFSHAAILLMHTLSGQWYTEIIAIPVCLIAYRLWRRKETFRLAMLGGAFVGSMALSSFYAIPALLEKDLVRIDVMTQGGLAVSQNMVKWDWITTPGFFSVGMTILFGVAALPIVAFFKRENPLTRQLMGWTLLTVVLGVMMFQVSAPIWEHLPLGQYIQFPWRFLGFIAIFGALSLGIGWALVVPAHAPWRWLLLILAIGFSIEDGLRSLPKVLSIGEADMPATWENVAAGIYSTVISDEFLPNKCTKPAKPRRTFAVPVDNRVHITAQFQSGVGYKLELEASGASAVDLEVHHFPGWTVKSNNPDGPQPTIQASPEGLVRVRLPAAGSYSLEVQFTLTRLRLFASIISGVTLFILLCGPALFLARRRQESAGHEIAKAS